MSIIHLMCCKSFGISVLKKNPLKNGKAGLSECDLENRQYQGQCQNRNQTTVN